MSRNSLAELPKIKHFGCGLALPLLKFTTLMIISPEKCHDWVAQISSVTEADDWLTRKLAGSQLFAHRVIPTVKAQICWKKWVG